jgi:hypothetical protein
MSAELANLVLSEPSPCDDCHRREACAARPVACAAFAAYSQGRPWQWAPRQPDAATYRQLFSRGTAARVPTISLNRLTTPDAALARR